MIFINISTEQEVKVQLRRMAHDEARTSASGAVIISSESLINRY